MTLTRIFGCIGDGKFRENYVKRRLMFKSRMKSGECLISFGAEFLSFNLLSTNINIKIYRTLILLAVFDGREKTSLHVEGGAEDEGFRE